MKSLERRNTQRERDTKEETAQSRGGAGAQNETHQHNRKRNASRWQGPAASTRPVRSDHQITRSSDHFFRNTSMCIGENTPVRPPATRLRATSTSMLCTCFRPLGAR